MHGLQAVGSYSKPGMPVRSDACSASMRATRADTHSSACGWDTHSVQCPGLSAHAVHHLTHILPQHCDESSPTVTPIRSLASWCQCAGINIVQWSLLVGRNLHSTAQQ